MSAGDIQPSLVAKDESEGADKTRRTSGFEWKTRAGFCGIPLICILYGVDEAGKQRIAKGFIAIGKIAIGGLAIGQYAIGLIAIGQVVLGVIGLGQLALSLAVGFGQVATGFFAVGQFVVGKYARGQFGWADYIWSPGRTDMEAVAMFETIDWLMQQDFHVIWENIKDAIDLGI
jgi:hypothetical protein